MINFTSSAQVGVSQNLGTFKGVYRGYVGVHRVRVSQNQGTFLGGLHNKEFSIWRSIFRYAHFAQLLNGNFPK